jgi:hypothetical protein
MEDASARCLSAACRMAPIILRGWVAVVNLDIEDISESRVVGRDRLGAVLLRRGDRGGGRGESSRDSDGVGDLVLASGTVSRTTLSWSSNTSMICSRSLSRSWILGISRRPDWSVEYTDDWCMSESCLMASARASSVAWSLTSSAVLAFDSSAMTAGQ